MKANQFIQNEDAEVGIGTMIVFVATILVAAVAAGVMISTGQKLQDKSSRTGSEATAAVGTSLEVVSLYGIFTVEGAFAVADDTDIDALNIWVQLNPGSAPIDLSEVVVSLITDTSTKRFAFENANGADNLFAGEGGGPEAASDFTGLDITEEIKVLKNDGVTAASTRAEFVIEAGEIGVIQIGRPSTDADSSVGTQLDIAEELSGQILLIPKQGLTTSVSFRTADSFGSQKVFELY